MSVDDSTLTEDPSDSSPAVFGVHAGRHSWSFRRYGRRHRPRVRKLRFLLVLVVFLVLAGTSTLFGILTAIASDLPKLANQIQFSRNVDSYMYDVNGTPIGPLAPASTPAIDDWGQISQNMVHAIVAVEDKGFWGESGISIRGLARAALSDLTGGQFQGGSTIPEEFIKNVRNEEGDRTVAEKLVEAGMAFQLSHHWSHEKILTEYLNTIYFGNGALGIEAAARVYFGWAHRYDAANPAVEAKGGCGDADPTDHDRKECASMLTPAQAALLAAVVANPTEYNPDGTDQERANLLWRRNNVVLRDMYQQHYLTYAQYERARAAPLPTRAEIQQPEQQPSAAPYFTSWVEPMVVRALEHEGLSPKEAQYQAYYGGLKIKLSIDLNLQKAAQSVVDNELFLGTGLPSASLVAIDNQNGEVRAMVSGDNDYAQSPFNLATMGYRQPGSSFKLFTLAAALSEGKVTPYTEIESKPLTIHWYYKHPGDAVAAPNGTGRFVVHNFGNAYGGWIPMTVATATSDNSVFAQLGTEIGTRPVRHYAKLLGIRSPISSNPAMVLGGLSTGVSALDMAHAYSTVANGGKKVYNGTLGDIDEGPIGIDSISNCGPCKGGHTITNQATMSDPQVITPEVASTIDELLHGPVDDSYGTGTAAAIPGVDVAGKTGTTSNYVDAWFVGWTPQMTVAVWVGYPNSGKAMLTSFNGKPVEGGTYPAIIWHNFMVQALQTLADESAAKNHTTDQSLGLQTVTTAAQQSTSVTQTAATTTATQSTDGVNGATDQTGAVVKTKAQQPGTQPTAPTSSKTGVTTKTGGTPQGTTTTPATSTSGTGTQADTTAAPTVTTTPATTGTSTSGGAGL